MGIAPPAGAALPAGTLIAWGAGTGGQLGNGANSDAASPVSVALPSGTTVTSVSEGANHGLAVTSTGSMLSWGTNSHGQLGNGTQTSSDTPGPVSLPANTNAIETSAGSGYSLALTDRGQVLAWGGNGSGQLGDGTQNTRLSPVSVHLPGGDVVTQISAGTAFALAVTTTGQVLAWGGNRDGELGNASGNGASTPIVVPLPAGVTATAVAAGGTFGLALSTSGQVYAWGTGPIGNGASVSATPVAVSLAAGTVITQIAAGGSSAYALQSDGEELAWGDGNAAQLGTGTIGSSTTPVAVDLSGTTVVDIAAGSQSAMALDSSGNVLTWGTGALGIGGTQTVSRTPVTGIVSRADIAVGLGSGPDSGSDLAVLQPAPEPVLQCQVITSSGVSGGVNAGTCGTFHASSSYVVDLGVSNANGSFTWTVPAGFTIDAGCTSATAFCDFTVRGVTADQELTTTVATSDRAGRPVTLSATADIPAVCGTQLC